MLVSAASTCVGSFGSSGCPLSVECDATLTTLCCGKFTFIDPVGLGVRPDLIVGCNIGLVSNAQDAGRLASITITMKRLHPWLIQGYPGLDLITKFSEANSGVLLKPRGDISLQPATLVLQSLRQIPMVECDGGRDASGLQCRYQVLVILNTGIIDRSSSLRQNPGPGEREPVACRSHLADQSRILFIVVVTVAGYFAV